MSFNPTDYISLLNGSGQQSEDQAPEDPFDDFLNIPDHYTFEDVGPSEPTLTRQEDSGRQVGFETTRGGWWGGNRVMDGLDRSARADGCPRRLSGTGWIELWIWAGAGMR